MENIEEFEGLGLNLESLVINPELITTTLY